MALLERLIKTQGQQEADLRHLKTGLEELKIELAQANNKVQELHDIVERTKGGWSSLTKGASLIAALIGMIAAVLSWLKGTR